MNLIEWDEEALKFIHSKMTNPFLDTILPYLRQPMLWIPLYGFIALFLWMNFKKKGLFIIGFAIICFIITDQVSAHIIKPYIGRLRPCKDVTIAPFLHQIISCGSGFSFPSTHATNHFGFAVFISLMLGKYHKWIVPALLLWASVISFSQVYLGLHYPVDVMFGALLGGIIGNIIGFIAKSSINLDSDYEAIRINQSK